MGHEVDQRGFNPDDYQVAATMGGIKNKRHPKCKGYYLEHQGEYDCDYDSNLTCEECKYGCGKKDPEATCNSNS